VKNFILNWLAYLFISFIFLLSKIFGMDNMRKMARKMEGKDVK